MHENGMAAYRTSSNLSSICKNFESTDGSDCWIHDLDVHFNDPSLLCGLRDAGNRVVLEEIELQAISSPSKRRLVMSPATIIVGLALAIVSQPTVGHSSLLSTTFRIPSSAMRYAGTPPSPATYGSAFNIPRRNTPDHASCLHWSRSAQGHHQRRLRQVPRGSAGRRIALRSRNQERDEIVSYPQPSACCCRSGHRLRVIRRIRRRGA